MKAPRDPAAGRDRASEGQPRAGTVTRMVQFALPDDHLAGDAEEQSHSNHAQAPEDAALSTGRSPGEPPQRPDRSLGAVPREAHEPIDLALIDRHVIQLFALVENAVAGATHALVSADREAARILVAADADIDALYQELEASVQSRLLDRPSNPSETQYLLAVLGMLPELERSGDLAEHVARRATRNLPAEMPARLRGYVQRMGEVACAMWRIAADGYGGDARSTTERLVALDDEMDDLHVTFIAELVAADTPVVVAIELALVGRFYERLGDHAVNLARRVPSRLRPIEP